MKLESKDIINAPLDVVFKLVRDDLEKIVPYLLNIKKIEMKERTEKNDELHLINHWYAKAEIPAVAQKFVKPELFSWKDTAIWKNKEYKVDYKLESFWANDLYSAKGTNSFKAINDKQTELTVSCEVEIYPDKVPGVPKFLMKQVLPAIEGLLTKALAPNLTALAKGLNEYFKKNA
ncbi:MAG: SRPBCC family protein [Bacteriovoracaceae bacterium]